MFFFDNARQAKGFIVSRLADDSAFTHNLALTVRKHMNDYDPTPG